jgi:hypothetical protein
MRSRRLTLSLDAGIKPEQDVIDYLEAHPQGRRQIKVRELLVLGVAAGLKGRLPYDRTQYSGLEPQSHRIPAYLRDDDPDDQRILAAIKDVPKPYQPARLKEAMVLGHLELIAQKGIRGTARVDAARSSLRPADSLASINAVPSLPPDQDGDEHRHLSSPLASNPAEAVAPPRHEADAGLENRDAQRETESWPLRGSSAATAAPSETMLPNPSDDKSSDLLGEVNAINDGEGTTTRRQLLQGLFQ